MGALALGAVALGAGCAGEVEASSARAGQTDAGSGAGGALAPPDENGGSTTLPGESEGGPDALDDCGRRLADLRPEGDARCAGEAGCADYKDHPGYLYEWRFTVSDEEARACVLSELLTRGVTARQHPQATWLQVTARYEDVAPLLPLRDLDFFTLHCAGELAECCGDPGTCAQNGLCQAIIGSRWDPACQCYHEETAGCILAGQDCLHASVYAVDPLGRCWGFGIGCHPVGWEGSLEPFCLEPQ